MKRTGSCTFRKLDNIGLSIIFILYQGDYNRMEQDGIRMPQPQSQSPQKTCTSFTVLIPIRHSQANIDSARIYNNQAMDEVAERLSTFYGVPYFTLLTCHRAFYCLESPAPLHFTHTGPFTTFHTENGTTALPPPSIPDTLQPYCTACTMYTTGTGLCPLSHSHNFWGCQGRNGSHPYVNLAVGKRR